MKKFAFSLDSLYELKKTMKDKIQAEYAAAEAVLAEKTRKKEALEKKLLEDRASYEDKVKKGMTICNIKFYLLYFEELQERIAAAGEDIKRAQKDVNRKKAELLAAHREIKALEKLYQKQYSEYIKEEEKRETSSFEDILSFNITGGEAQNAGALS